MTTPAWLEDLEEKVHLAAARLHELKRENEALAARVRQLEEQLDGTGEGAWTEEREEIRQRVEALAEHLEGLLSDR